MRATALTVSNNSVDIAAVAEMAPVWTALQAAMLIKSSVEQDGLAT